MDAREATAPPDFDRAIDAYMVHARVEGGLSAATLDAYGRDLRELAVHMGTLGAATPDLVTMDMLAAHIRHLGTERGLDPRSIVRHLATMRIFFRWLHANGRIRRDPARLLERPTTWKRLPGTMTPGQMKRLVEAPSPDDGPLWLRDRAMLELMYASGLRASEVGALKLSDFDRDELILKVTGKGNKQRLVPVGKPAAAILERYLAECRPQLARHEDRRDKYRILLSAHGRPLERVAVWQIVKRAARTAGIQGVHPHLLRHSFATHLVAGGADLRVIQELLGHADIGTTQVYTHVDRSHLRKTIARFHPRELRKTG